ncbi:DUF1465 family protein [Sphingomonas mollis]|uniref:DUF1465 family protein n=1 Tax=Sphingomonas mollis TaxID=2795726 RepID=A0ABS0XP21_9SPHN|nr:DUF1465 family protein [Sphingomonas sp. BT553]MBJ6121776.1 DUF1465 family protein [Sphingomonas sp. BT553]
MTPHPPAHLHRRLLDGLYIDAMVLADEARHYIEGQSREDSDALAPIDRVLLSCESLKVTTRLMHVLAWLLMRKAIDAGEIAPADALMPARRLGPSSVVDPDVADRMPDRARWLIDASETLYRRAAMLEAGYADVERPASPARVLQLQLAAGF